jgi:xylulokinase
MLLALDIGSSSVIAGILHGKKTIAEAPRVFFKTHHNAGRVEVLAPDMLDAVTRAIAGLDHKAKSVDAIALAVMAPAWVVMDKNGAPLTPIVTHQDRRSVLQAIDIEKRIGRARHLRITGNRPFPGGISSTTWAWYQQHQPARLRRASLIGHLNTFLHRHITGARVIDPSNASFTGLYNTLTLAGWSPELCAAHHIDPAILPEVLDANVIAGHVTPSAAATFGLRAGTPMMTGLMDGSAGMLTAGAIHGQLFNVCGSTDVLALCTDTPRPHPRLLTRALGIGRKWLAVSTLAAVASAIYWARDQFFSEWPIDRFQAEFFRLGRLGPRASGGVTFHPYMAGERTSIDQRTASFTGITLATTREHILSAIIEGLIKASAERFPLLQSTGTPMLPRVVVSGGADRLDNLMHRDWPGQWKFRAVTDATMRGLALMTPIERA